MDIDGAKALQERLARTGAVAAQRAPEEVPAHAPPVYHWFGVANTPDRAVTAPADAGHDSDRRSWLGRARLGFRPTAR
jgi:acetyl esterase/lipase